MLKSILVKKQVKQLIKENVTVNGQKYNKVVCNIRYDDECGNGHNSFAITGEFYVNQREITNGNPSMCGCCHEELLKVFPEIAHLIKWHLTSSDGPMHYIANTLYHARDCDTANCKVGDPTKFEKFVLLGNSEYPHKFGSGFTAFLEEAQKSGWILKPLAIAHKKEPNGYNFSDKYTIEGFKCEWYQCPFDDINTVTGFCNTAIKQGFAIGSKPVSWAKAVTPNLEAARNSAVWQDATLEQLQDKDALQSRLPALMAAFQGDIESFGFTY